MDSKTFEKQASHAENRKVIGEVRKNKTAKVVVTTNEYKGHKFVDLRVFFTKDADAEDATYIPTRKGLTLKPEMTEDLIEQLRKAAKQIEEEKEAKKKKE